MKVGSVFKFNLGSKIDQILQKFFFSLGKLVAKVPVITIGIAVLLTFLFGLGILKMKVITEPIELWVPPTSNTAIEKQYFDKMFTPFYRVEQIIITPKSPDVDLLSKDVIRQIYYLQKRIKNIRVTDPDDIDKHYTVNELCFTPVPNKGCMVDSVTEYWQDDIEKIEADEDVKNTLYRCW